MCAMKYIHHWANGHRRRIEKERVVSTETRVSTSLNPEAHGHRRGRGKRQMGSNSLERKGQRGWEGEATSSGKREERKERRSGGTGEVGPHWTQTEKEEGGENNSLAHLKVHTQKMCSWTRGCHHQCKILQPWWFFYRNTVVTVTMSKCKWLYETSDIS